MVIYMCARPSNRAEITLMKSHDVNINGLEIVPCVACIKIGTRLI